MRKILLILLCLLLVGCGTVETETREMPTPSPTPTAVASSSKSVPTPTPIPTAEPTPIPTAQPVYSAPSYTPSYTPTYDPIANDPLYAEAGRFYIPSVGINVGLAQGCESQAITDRADTAWFQEYNFWSGDTTHVIADHNNQDFSNLTGVSVGDEAVIENPDGTTYSNLIAVNDGAANYIGDYDRIDPPFAIYDDGIIEASEDGDHTIVVAKSTVHKFADELIPSNEIFVVKLDPNPSYQAGYYKTDGIESEDITKIAQSGKIVLGYLTDKQVYFDLIKGDYIGIEYESYTPILVHIHLSPMGHYPDVDWEPLYNEKFALTPST